MTTQRLRPRTPRKEKLWANRRTFFDVSTPSSPMIVTEPLDPTFTDMGLTTLAGVTVMRVIGRLTLIIGGDAPSTPAWDWMRFGLIWVRDEIANASAGGGQIPEPFQDGPREADWIQQWEIGGIEQTSGLTGAPLSGSSNRNGYENVEFDVTQMRKQPTVNHRLVLIGTGGTLWEPGTVDLDIQLSTMIALP